MNPTQLMDEADALALLPEKRARCQSKESLLKQSGREIPARPAFTAGDVLGESDALDLHESRMTSTLRHAAASLKDPLSPESLALEAAQAKAEILAAETAIRAAGGDVPQWTGGNQAPGSLGHCAALQSHAGKLMRLAKSAGLEVRVPATTGKPATTTTTTAGQKLTVTQQCIAANARLAQVREAEIPTHAADGRKLSVTERCVIGKQMQDERAKI